MSEKILIILNYILKEKQNTHKILVYLSNKSRICFLQEITVFDFYITQKSY
jgi:hypothetical protein